MSDLVNFIKRKPILMSFFSYCYNFFGRSKLVKHGKNNFIKTKDAFIVKTMIEIKGNNNSIDIEPFCRLNSCHILIIGNDNHIIIKQKTIMKLAEMWLEDNNNKIEIGEKCSFAGKIQLAATEGKSILIGKNCLFSENIYIRTGDSHTIYLEETNTRINAAKDVMIGNHVWICEGATILKGAKIGDNSIVGSKAVVESKFDESNIILCGIPATIKKHSINWDISRK